MFSLQSKTELFDSAMLGGSCADQLDLSRATRALGFLMSGEEEEEDGGGGKASTGVC